ILPPTRPTLFPSRRSSDLGFYPGETVEAHLNLRGRWLRRHGRPVALDTDRDSILAYQSKGRGDPDGLTQFGRALRELDSTLILRSEEHTSELQSRGHLVCR